MPQWEVLICGHHPGYIAWEDYLASQERLHANCPAPPGQGGGAVREGRGLLQGIVRCGRCGRMMRTGYQGSRHKHLPRYYCAAEGTYLGRRAYCQGAGGRQIEQAVAGEVLAVLEPAALAATAQALADAGAARAERLRAFELAAERARYEAGRARRQYDACEPENRLAARSLEAAWEDRLAAVTRAGAALATEQARQPSPLSAEETGWLTRAGAGIRAIFEAPATTPRERKQLIRALLSEVTLTVDRQPAPPRSRCPGKAGPSRNGPWHCPGPAPRGAPPRRPPWTSSAASPRTTTTRRSRACSPASTAAPAPA